MGGLSTLESLLISAALGFLVGLQRQRADSALAGIRTFPLIAVLGTVCAMLAPSLGGWVLAAGFISLAAVVVAGNLVVPREPDERPGITTEVAILLMFALGAFVWRGDRTVAVALGVAMAALLNAKPFLHRFAERLGEGDVRAILQFAVITFVILPVLPDEPMGPLNVFNPHKVWLLVVLMVGISLAGYVAYKLLGPEQGTVLAGVLGGVASSTATTASYARLARESPGAGAASLVVFMLATTVVYARVAIEIAVVAPGAFRAMSPPVFAMMAAAAIIATVVFVLNRRTDPAIPDRENPAQLKAAVVMAMIFAAVLFATAAAEKFLGDAGLYAVAAVSGLSDMDSITISVSRMAERGDVNVDTAWRAIVLASISNLCFKAGIVATLAGRAVFLRTCAMFSALAAVGLALMAFW